MCFPFAALCLLGLIFFGWPGLLCALVACAVISLMQLSGGKK